MANLIGWFDCTAGIAFESGGKSARSAFLSTALLIYAVLRSQIGFEPGWCRWMNPEAIALGSQPTRQRILVSRTDQQSHLVENSAPVRPLPRPGVRGTLSRLVTGQRIEKRCQIVEFA